MSFLKPIDPVYFHHDVLNALDKVNGLQPKTLLATVFVKKPIQLFLACFSSVLSVVAAVREAFIALGALFTAAATLLYSKAKTYLYPEFRGEVKGWETCKFHATRAGCQLLGLPVSLAGIPGIFYSTFEWVINKHLELHNYQRAEGRALPAVPAAAPPRPPVRTSVVGIPPLPPAREGVAAASPAAAAPPPTPTSPKTAPLKPAAKKKRVKFGNEGSAQAANSSSPILKEKRSLDGDTVRRKFQSTMSSSAPDEPSVTYIQQGTFKRNEGWYATNLQLSYLKEQIPGFAVTPLEDKFEQPIDDLFEYIQTINGIVKVNVDEKHTLDSWDIYIVALGDAREGSFPKVFITKNIVPEGVKKASQRCQASNKTIKSPDWSDNDDDEETAAERAKISSSSKTPTSPRPSVMQFFSNEDLSAQPAKPAERARPVITLSIDGRVLPTPNAVKDELPPVDERVIAGVAALASKRSQ